MPETELDNYHVGQCGWIEVLDGAGKQWFWVEGEIARLMPVSETCVWALIRARTGTGVYRLW